jgi:hypothetical protein
VVGTFELKTTAFEFKLLRSAVAFIFLKKRKKDSIRSQKVCHPSFHKKGKATPASPATDDGNQQQKEGPSTSQ